MGGFETPIYFDALAIGVLVGGMLLLGSFLWVILDRREFEDPLRRRERRARERDARRAGESRAEAGHSDPAAVEGPHGEDEPRPHDRRRRRRVA